jgi:hypothetical protein
MEAAAAQLAFLQEQSIEDESQVVMVQVVSSSRHQMPEIATPTPYQTGCALRYWHFLLSNIL